MTTPKAMRARAAECRAMAARESDPTLRLAFLEMAERWEGLAISEEQAARVRASVDRSPPDDG